MYDILAWRGMLDRCREQFLLDYKAEIESFDDVDQLFPHFSRAAGKIQVATARQKYDLAPFIQVMQVHARAAFELLAGGQSHLAWPVLRSFVEALLVMGKWIEDPQHAVVWHSRHAGKSARKEYQEIYGGSGTRAESLPHEEVLRGVAGRLADDFIETNPRYYAHPLVFGDGKSRNSSREDEADRRAHVYAVLHLEWFVMHAAGRLLSAREGGRAELRVDLERFERTFGPAAEAIAREHQAHKVVLTQLGLWPYDLLHTRPPH